MDTKDLASFRAVYEYGSMAKAAQRLFITPQGLSRTIAALETELGHELFSRTNRGVEPTAYAKALYPKAAKIAALLDSIEHDAADTNMRCMLDVACVSGGLSYLGPDFKRDFEAAHPDIGLNVEEANDRRVAEQVRTSMADCGFVSGDVDYTTFEAQLFARHPHSLLVAVSDPLATRSTVSLADLAGRRLAIMGAGFSPYSYIQARLARQGIVPEEITGVAEISTALHMFGMVKGLVVITTDFAVPPSSRHDLAVLPFDDIDFTWDVSFIWRRGTRLAAETCSFIDFASAWYAAHEHELFTWRNAQGPWRLYSH